MLTSGARDDLTVSAPQLGKTIGLGLWVVIGAWRDAQAGIPLPTWWAAPTYLMATQGMEKTVELARSVGMLRDYRQSPPKITLRNGGVIEGRSWEVPENIFGPTVARIGVDEFGHLTAKALAALSSRVSETRTKGHGFMRFAGNVGEIGGCAEELWRRAVQGGPGWAARTWTWRDRAAAAECVCGLNGQGLEIEHADLHGPSCERGLYLAEMRKLQGTMSAAHFRQLYGAEWIDWSALPAYTFDRTVHVTADVHEEPSLPLDLSCDFNVDPMAWVVGQHKGREAWALDEIIIPGGATTKMACEEFLRRYPGGKRELNLYGDASGNSGSTKSKQSDYDIIRQLVGAAYPNLSVQVPESNPPVSTRLNSVNAMLEPALGEPRYYVHPRCEHLATDLARVGLKPGTREIDKSNKQLTHPSDADGYRLTYLFPVGADTETPSVVVVSDSRFNGGIFTAGV